MSRRLWKTMHEYLDMYFNDLFVKNRDSLRKMANTRAMQYRMIKRIEESSNSYLNDDDIIAEKKKSIKNLTEKMSKTRSLNKRLLKYTMLEQEINQLSLHLNKQIMIEVMRGKYYNIPFYMGKIRFRYVKFNNRSLTINWVKSLENHLAITKKYAPIVNDKFVNQKTLTKKQYFALSKKYVAPLVPERPWLSYNEGGDWLYLSWFPNYPFINKFKNYYRCYFTRGSGLVYHGEMTSYKTVDILSYLDTEEDILNSLHLGNVNKSILLQLKNSNYKYKVEEE